MALPEGLPDTREASHAFYAEIRAANPTKRAWDQAERWLATNDLFYLLVYLLRRPDLDHPWLYDRVRMVQAEPNGFLDLWSREHGKSSVITFGLTIFDILNNPNVTVGIFSHSKRIAKGFLQVIMREFQDNLRLQELFPDVLWSNPWKDAPNWSEDGIIVRRSQNPKEATIECHGLDSQPTGRHFQLMIYDDVVTRESVATPEQIRKTTDGWALSLNLSVQEEKGGRIRYIGTRYNLHDTYSEIIKRGAAIPRIFPATHNGRFDGKPVFFSQAEFDKRVKTQGLATSAAQLLQDPRADGSNMFQVHWLSPYEVRPRTINCFLMVDPSMGRTTASDNTAMAVVGISSTGNKYLLDGCCERLPLSRRWSKLKALYLKWSRMPGVQHIAVGYERYGMQSDIEFIEERQMIEKVMFPIQELNWTRDGSTSKADRVARLEPDFRAGRFYLSGNVLIDNKPHFWKIGDDPDVKGFGELQYRPVEGLTKAQMAMIQSGSPDLVAKAIKCVDEEGHSYDLTMSFIQEYESFPHGRLKDLIDSVSRVYDMSPTRPTLTSGELTEPESFFDS